MQPPIFKIAFFASFLCMAVYANQDPEEPKLVRSETPSQLPQIKAVTGLLDVMSNTNMMASQEDGDATNFSNAENSMSAYVIAASKAEKQFDEDRQQCSSLAMPEQYDCMITSNANYEVIKADAETLRGVAFISGGTLSDSPETKRAAR